MKKLLYIFEVFLRTILMFPALIFIGIPMLLFSALNFIFEKLTEFFEYLMYRGDDALRWYIKKTEKVYPFTKGKCDE
jgi:hypothetical protein